MKVTKKILLTVLALALVVASVMGMVACNQEEPDKSTEVVITVDSEVMADVEGKFLIDYMNAMKEKNLLEFEGSEGTYGLYIESVNGRKADSTVEFWAIYTDDAENSSEAYGVYEVNGKKCASASLGVSSLPLKADATYVLVLKKIA